MRERIGLEDIKRDYSKETGVSPTLDNFYKVVEELYDDNVKKEMFWDNQFIETLENLTKEDIRYLENRHKKRFDIKTLIDEFNNVYESPWFDKDSEKRSEDLGIDLTPNSPQNEFGYVPEDSGIDLLFDSSEQYDSSRKNEEQTNRHRGFFANLFRPKKRENSKKKSDVSDKTTDSFYYSPSSVEPDYGEDKDVFLAEEPKKDPFEYVPEDTGVETYLSEQIERDEKKAIEFITFDDLLNERIVLRECKENFVYFFDNLSVDAIMPDSVEDRVVFFVSCLQDLPEENISFLEQYFGKKFDMEKLKMDYLCYLLDANSLKPDRKTK